MTTTVAPDTGSESTHDTVGRAASAQGTSGQGTSGKGPTAPGSGLGAEVRESLLLLGFAVGVTVGLTTAAQAALALLG